MSRADVSRVYDLVADDYAATFYHELERKPFDRELLDRFVNAVPVGGRMCDMGCGPGHLARYLSERGLDTFGLDLAPGMVEVARRLNPGIDFAIGDMCDSGLPPASLAGIVAFYSIIHLDRSELPHAFISLQRSLMPGGLLLVAFHKGSGQVSAEDWFGKGVSISANLLDPDYVECVVAECGLQVLDSLVREPYEFEYPTERAYLLAANPEAS